MHHVLKHLCLAGALLTISACSADEVLRAVYESGKQICGQVSNCDMPEKNETY